MAKRLRDLADLPVTELKGVGPERAKALAQIEIASIFDLLTHYPRRYIDKTKQSSIRDLRVDELSWVYGKVVSSATVPGRGRGKARTELRISDGSGYLRITFFNQPWRARQFPEGSEAMFFGKVTDYRGQKQLANPEIDLLDEEDRLQITALYPSRTSFACTPRTSGAGSGSRSAAPRCWSSPCPRGCSTSTTSSTARRRSRASTSPSRWRRRKRRGGGWCSTSCCGSSSPWCCASG